MEPNKLENEIREKLGKREIHPSAQAWDRLDAMLSVQESKAEKKSFPWLRIAAAVVLFLGVSYFFFNSSEKSIKENNSNIVVVEDFENSSNDEINTEESDVVKSSQSIINQENSAIVYSESKSKSETIGKKVNARKKDYTKEILPVVLKENQVAHSDVKNEAKTIEDKADLKIISENKQAIAEIKAPVEKAKLKIDPNSLLDQVDGEIQLTFRQKVMQTVTKGYKEAKEAVASRNQESSINH